MLTGKPISSISFNSQSYLNKVLNDLVDREIIEFYAYIWHKPEPKETNDPEKGKEHFHLYMEPNMRVDTMKLRKEFNEIDLTNPEPRKILKIVKSKFPDWYLYGLHNPDYLMLKEEVRFYTYKKEDIITNDYDTLNNLISSVKLNEINIHIEVYKYQEMGYSFSRYSARKGIHPNQMRGYREVWDSVYQLRLEERYEFKEQKESAEPEGQRLLTEEKKLIENKAYT